MSLERCPVRLNGDSRKTEDVAFCGNSDRDDQDEFAACRGAWTPTARTAACCAQPSRTSQAKRSFVFGLMGVREGLLEACAAYRDPVQPKFGAACVDPAALNTHAAGVSPQMWWRAEVAESAVGPGARSKRGTPPLPPHPRMRRVFRSTMAVRGQKRNPLFTPPHDAESDHRRGADVAEPVHRACRDLRRSRHSSIGAREPTAARLRVEG